jgi:hypothetical protein
MPTLALPNQRFSIVFQNAPERSSRIVAYGVSEAEARELLKRIAHEHGQVVAAPLSVTADGQTWEAVPLNSQCGKAGPRIKK